MRSLHSTTIQPQVEGRVTKIFVKSGDGARRRAARADRSREAGRDRAQHRVAARAAREADVTYWKGQVERLQSLLKAGAISQNEFDTGAAQPRQPRRRTSPRSTRRCAKDAVQLQYYRRHRADAPASSATSRCAKAIASRPRRSITTIDDKAGLEAYIQVPLDRAPELRLGLPVADPRRRRQGGRDQPDHVRRAARRSERRRRCSRRRCFARTAAGDASPAVRRERASSGASMPGLTMPVTAVAAHQRPVFQLRRRAGRTGAGREAAARCRSARSSATTTSSGRPEAGRPLIVSGIQKIADGAPVKADTPTACHHVRQYLHPPADSRVGLLAGHHPRRGCSPFRRCRSRSIPSLAPPQITGRPRSTPARTRRKSRRAVTTPLEQAINGVEGMLYMTSSSTNSGFATITVTFDITRDQDLAQVDVQNRVNQALGRMPAEVRTTGITVQKQSTGFIAAVGVYSEHGEYDSLFLSNYLDLYVRDAIKRVPGVGDVTIFGERKYSMRLWLDPRPPGRAADHRQRRRQRAARAERAGRGRQPRPGAGAGRADVSAQRARRGPADRGRRVRQHHRQGGGRRGARAPQGRRTTPSSAPRPTPPSSASRAVEASASASSSCRPPTRSTSYARRWSPSSTGCRSSFRPG